MNKELMRWMEIWEYNAEIWKDRKLPGRPVRCRQCSGQQAVIICKTSRYKELVGYVRKKRLGYVVLEIPLSVTGSITVLVHKDEIKEM